MKALEHFKTITHHRHLVMKGCFAVGLYKQGLLHDLSKYSPVEFLVGAKYYQGDKSPNNAEREDKGVSLAWLHHKGRNKHHFEYWIDYGLDKDHKMTGMEMPVNYVVEMYVDRVAACKNYQKEAYTDASALEYYNKGKGKYLMHKNTAALLENMLEYLAAHGEKATNEYIRKNILCNK
ncbi:MAG: catalase [Pseudobutyrivibrio ruminis]|nr:catalase [Pseudobutyrivibrio ruminis]